MARESRGYRDQLESIIAAFPNGERLTVADVAHYTGWSRRVVSRISLLKSLMELSLLRAPHLHDYFHRRDHAWKLRSK